MKKRIIFVDDEPSILDGLGRMLRDMRHDWEMRFATSGKDALDILSAEPFDLIVSDMRMPLMNGLQLLTEVKARFPGVIRMILSGYSDQSLIMRSVGIIHQYMSKPCDAAVIRTVIGRALELRALLSDERLVRLISRLSNLPSLPSLHHEIVAELQSPNASSGRIGDIVAHDPAMTAKILQLVNSAFFGIRRKICSAREAVSFIGIETIQALVLSLNAFDSFRSQGVPNYTIENIWSHSVIAGIFAKRILQKENGGDSMADAALTAGLLHDLGKLVLASNLPEEYGKVLRKVTHEGISFPDAERDVFGSTHEEVGAYLLGLWGLPDLIVESVAWHHRPSQCKINVFGLLAAVHTADVLEHRLSSRESIGPLPKLDVEFLQTVQKNEKIDVWTELCANSISSSTP